MDLVRFGRMSYWDVYEMPTYLRKYNLKKLLADLTKEKEMREAASGKPSGASQLATGDPLKTKTPDYIAKAPSKR